MVVPFDELRVDASTLDKEGGRRERIATVCKFDGMDVEKAGLDRARIGKPGDATAFERQLTYVAIDKLPDCRA